MKAAHQIIYTHGGGRLGNQVLRFLHWIAWVRAQAIQVEVLNLSFWPFAEYFAHWQEHPGCVFPTRPGLPDTLATSLRRLPVRWQAALAARQRLPRAVHAAGHWWPGWRAIGLDVARGEGLELDDAAFLARVRRGGTTTCSGWKIASWRLVAEQANELRAFFRPAPAYERSAAACVGRLRQSHDVVVGVFIRQSDYRTWHDGRFYFSSAHYAAWIRQLLARHGGPRIAFLLAAEERQDPAVFAGLPCFFASGTQNAGGHWFESWAELSQCDFILTPPSTFSATAAFVGGVPLWPVLTADQRLAPEQRIEDGMIGAARHPVFSLAVK